MFIYLPDIINYFFGNTLVILGNTSLLFNKFGY